MKTKVFSGMGALIGALAGLVTVGVGLITIGSQTGWFGIDKGDKAGSTTSTLAPQSQRGTSSGNRTSPGAPGSAATTAPEFEVDKSELNFGLLAGSEGEVQLKNTGEAPFAVGRPVVQGSDAFRAQDVDCLDAPLGEDQTCTVKVVLAEQGAHEGTLKIPIGGDAALVGLESAPL